MAPSGAEYIRNIKSQITEIDPKEVDAVKLDPRVSIIDVREADEVEQGKIPGATHIPRGFLESRIDGVVPDRDQKVVVYCAAGSRSALAAKTLTDLGFNDVESMTGGFTLWKDRGYDTETPFTFTPDQRARYSRHFLLNEVGQDGQKKLLNAKVLLLGAGAALLIKPTPGAALRPRLSVRADKLADEIGVSHKTDELSSTAAHERNREPSGRFRAEKDSS